MGSRGGRRNRSDDFSVLHEELSDLTFGLYSAKEIKKLSACLVYNPVAFNQLGHPVAGMTNVPVRTYVSKTHVVMALNLGCPEIQDIEFFLTLSEFSRRVRILLLIKFCHFCQAHNSFISRIVM